MGLSVIVLTNVTPAPGGPSHADALARTISALHDPALSWPDGCPAPLKPPEAGPKLP